MEYLIFGVVCLFAIAAFAEIRAEPVRYEANGTSLVGSITYDDALGAKPAGVVIFPEWWGANDYPKSRAKMLAQLGYVALVADMYGDGKTTADPKEAGALAQQIYGKPDVMVARAKAAVQQLKMSGRCDPQRVAAIGYCMGGSIALNLARTGEDLQAIVGFHCGLASRVPAGEPGTIKAKILVMNGADDKMVSPEETQKFEDEMRTAQADWELVLFGNAVHAYSNPAADKYKDIGSLGYSPTADRRSWELMRLMLTEALGQNPQ
jgi:dienelactone hydrolase